MEKPLPQAQPGRPFDQIEELAVPPGGPTLPPYTPACHRRSL